MLLHLATGLTLSSTVTVLLQVETLPLLSVTVRVTVLGPTLAQVKLFGLTLLDARPQASLLPLSTSAGIMPAWPVTSSWTVMFFHAATGRVPSPPVIVAL